jgi:Macrocin-O-methyltransferase (TylF)
MKWRSTTGSLERFLSLLRDLILDAWDSVSTQEFSQLYRKVRPFTMCGNARLRGLHRAVHYVVAKNIPGDLVECGTAQGGSASLMGLTLKRLGSPRTLWVLDTFEGLPAPTAEDPDREIAQLYTGSCRASVAEVSALFERLGILGECQLVKGRFQETLPAFGPRNIAVLHIDGDWYDSVRVCLEELFDQVSPGGVIQIDDYGHWKGARRAVDEFMKNRSIKGRLQRLDYTGRQLIKPNGK